MSSGDAFLLRSATAADVRDLAGVQLRSALAGFSHIFPASIPKPTQPGLEEEWRVLLEDPSRAIFVAVVGSEPIAAVVYGEDVDGRYPTDAVLLKLYVDPAHAGKGIGSALHDHAIGAMQATGLTRVRLWVLERNLVARRMYERRGWTLEPWSRSDFPGSGILELGYSLYLSGC